MARIKIKIVIQDTILESELSEEYFSKPDWQYVFLANDSYGKAVQILKNADGY